MYESLLCLLYAYRLEYTKYTIIQAYIVFNFDGEVDYSED